MERNNQNIKTGLFYIIIIALVFAAGLNFRDTWFSPPKNSFTNTFENNQDFAISTFDIEAYGKLPLVHIQNIARDFDSLATEGLYYQPWVQFSEPLFTSENVNIITDPTGLPIRKTVNPQNVKNLPVYKIYFFGGSCTFGYNVSDAETMCSYLSKILNEQVQKKNLPIYIEVENYGRAFYDPSQEMQLMIEVAKLGPAQRAGPFIRLSTCEP